MDFIDLKKQQELIRKNIDNRISKVLNHGQYILGPEVKELENNLSLFSDKLSTSHNGSCKVLCGRDL